jgi:hypothetical protein
MAGWLWMINFERRGKKLPWPVWRYYPRFCLEGLRTTTKKNWIRRASLSAEIRTEDLSGTAPFGLPNWEQLILHYRPSFCIDAHSCIRTAALRLQSRPPTGRAVAWPIQMQCMSVAMTPYGTLGESASRARQMLISRNGTDLFLWLNMVLMAMLNDV